MVWWVPKSRPLERYYAKVAQNYCTVYGSLYGISYCFHSYYAMVGFRNRNNLGRPIVRWHMVVNLLRFLQTVCLCVHLDIQHCPLTFACYVLVSEVTSWTHRFHYGLLDSFLWRRWLLPQMGIRLLVCKEAEGSQPYNLYGLSLANSITKCWNSQVQLLVGQWRNLVWILGNARYTESLLQ